MTLRRSRWHIPSITGIVRKCPTITGRRNARAQRIVSLAAWLAFLLVIASCMNAAGDAGRSVLQVAGGDLLEINVFDIPELSGKFRVSNTGSISLPLIGELAVQDNRTDQVDTRSRRSSKTVVTFAILR